MYDAHVIGLGSMGASALYHLAKAGLNVVGIERFGIVHDSGSHSGQTRLIRKAYFEDERYIPLLESAYNGWKEIEQTSGNTIYTESGLAYFGESDHPIVQGVYQAANSHRLPFRACSNREKAPFALPDSFESRVEIEAGFLRADIAIKSFVEAAKKTGAQVFQNETVRAINYREDIVEVETDKRIIRAGKAVICAGSYISELIPEMKNRVQVSRQMIGWVKPKTNDLEMFEQMSAWVIADKTIPGIYYGFPMLDDVTHPMHGQLKFAHHTIADSIHPTELHQYDPETEEAKLRRILEQFLPELADQPISLNTCMYTNTNDEQFILDYLPDSGNKIVLAAGFSGHGFKFAPVIGEIVTDLVARGTTQYNIDFLGLDR
ncbi:MAG: N-methyl-L-tryptophan oxidase [Balneolaceae bacterium]|nr:N-methyl-L-tryptophan oxidase [Balneolaceae bacterium]